MAEAIGLADPHDELLQRLSRMDPGADDQAGRHRSHAFVRAETSSVRRADFLFSADRRCFDARGSEWWRSAGGSWPDQSQPQGFMSTSCAF
jgi:hypothetical protein